MNGTSMDEPRAGHDADPAPAARTPIGGSHARVDSVRGFVLELIIVTVGVLIALSVDSARQWTQERTLVRQAKATIAQELMANKRDLDRKLADASTQSKTDNALRLVDQLLTVKKSAIDSFEVGFHLAELSDASWRTAERTGALSKMAYTDVQRYSQVYDLQALYMNQQRQGLARATEALAIITGDPHTAAAKDLEAVRVHLLGMRGDLFVERQLGERLSQRYKEVLEQ
jgi:hypothetical protein